MVHCIEELEEVEENVGWVEDLKKEEVRVGWVGDLEENGDTREIRGKLGRGFEGG